MKRTAEARFWEKVDKNGQNPQFPNCWEWTAYKLFNGYGRFSINSKTDYAHRISWQFASGKYPKGKQVLHGCDNPACVNPEHLFLGTLKDNMADRNKKGRQQTLKKLNCRHGYPFSYNEKGKRVAVDCPTCQTQRKYARAQDPAHRKAKAREYARNVRRKKKLLG